MKQLAEVRSNVYFEKKIDEQKNEVLKKRFELVFVTDEAGYTRTNDGEISRVRKLKEQRFTVSEDGLTQLIANLLLIQKNSEEK